MSIIEKIKLMVLAMLLGIGGIYLAIAFIYMSLNPLDWDFGARYFFSCTAVSVFLGGIGYVIISLNSEN